MLAADRAEQALRHIVILRIQAYPHLSLLGRVWELRNALSAYDATYVALAERLNISLITCDRRLGATHGHYAQIEVF
jgi:predicted nucleic acid-binding protein